MHTAVAVLIMQRILGDNNSLNLSVAVIGSILLSLFQFPSDVSFVSLFHI